MVMECITHTGVTVSSESAVVVSRESAAVKPRPAQLTAMARRAPVAPCA